MFFREAKTEDIISMHKVRCAVWENALSNPSVVTEADYISFLNVRGKGWVCEIENTIVGFAIVDLKENNIWALFVHPDFEKRGIGKKLHELMLDWYFRQTQKTVWLGTAPDTRAEEFYLLQGWKRVGRHGTKEVKFEMNFSGWMKLKH